MLKFILEIVFYGLMLMFGLFSFAMIFTLVKFGRSMILSLTVSAFFLIIMFVLYASALGNFNNISFPAF